MKYTLNRGYTLSIQFYFSNSSSSRFISFTFERISLITGFEDDEFLNSSSLNPKIVSNRPMIRENNIKIRNRIGIENNRLSKIKTPREVSL